MRSMGPGHPKELRDPNMAAKTLVESGSEARPRP